ncbi:MAG: hypothetical protein ACREF7_03085, partial [Candidatus Saccharimonadales bacterium]
TKDKRDIVLFYAARSADHVAYKEVLSQAEASFGLKVYYVLSEDHGNSGLSGVIKGKLNLNMLEQLVPDLASRLVYISGPPSLIEDMKRSLVSIGLSRANIKVDFFSGYT